MKLKPGKFNFLLVSLIAGMYTVSCQSIPDKHRISGFLYTNGDLNYLSDNAELLLEVNLLQTDSPQAVPVVLEQIQIENPNQWPIQYTLEFDPELNNPAYTYTLQALASFNSQLIAITTLGHRVSLEKTNQQYDLLVDVLGAQTDPITSFTIYCGLNNYELSIYRDKLVNDDLQDYRRLIYKGDTGAGENTYTRDNQTMIMNPEQYPLWMIDGIDQSCGQ